MAGLPPEIQRVLEWYSLLLQAEFARIEADYRKEFAEVESGEVVALVETFILDRFDAGAAWLAVGLGVPTSSGIALYENAS